MSSSKTASSGDFVYIFMQLFLLWLTGGGGARAKFVNK